MSLTRRDFVRSASAAAAAAALPAVAAHGQDSVPIKIGLVGCGGRGTTAAENCMRSSPNVHLVALGDIFPERLKKSRLFLGGIKDLKENFKVTDDACFTGFDAIKRVLDTGVDLVLITTPPGFRPRYFELAVEAGKHCFLEKPVAVDSWGVRKVIEVGERARQKKLGVLAGTQYRHQVSFQETIKRIQEEKLIGEILGGVAYYNTGTLWHYPRKEGQSDMEYQIRNWLYYDWLSGDHIVEQHLHTIDVTDWVMGGRPVRAVAVGGRQVRVEEEYGHIYDHFCVDYEYPNGAHVMSMTRQFANTDNHIGAYFTGTKGQADPYTGLIIDHHGKVVWQYPGKPDIFKAYVQEHGDLIASIRSGAPINEARQIAESTLTAIMGREAAYTGKSIEWNAILNAPMDFSPPQYEFGELPVRPVRKPGKPETWGWKG